VSQCCRKSLTNFTAIKSAVVRMESFNPVISENPLLLTQDVLLWIAACAEQMSEHPLARALLQSAKLRGLLLEPLGEDVAVSHVGSGVRCISGLGTVLVGNRSLMEASDVVRSQAVEAALWDLEVQGKTAVCVALNNSILGVLGIADVAKSEARSTIRALHGLNIDVWMLTGDSRTTAEALAEEVGIPKDRVLAGALPVDKVDKVRALQDLDQFVAMVGDGVNDSPALAQADLGVAIGTGTQVAIEAADMVLIRNHLHDLVVALDLAKVVFARIRYNFAWAMIYNVVSIPYAAGCFFWYTHLLLPPQYAGLAMAMSSISVVMSSMALRFYRRPMSLLQDDHVLLQPTVLQKATRQLMSIKDGLKETVKQVSRRRSGGQQYQQLARDEQEADQSLGLELGLGGMGGLVSARRSSSHNRESSDYDDVV
jgi:Cu+-exporting ATPase